MIKVVWGRGLFFVDLRAAGKTVREVRDFWAEKFKPDDDPEIYVVYQHEQAQELDRILVDGEEIWPYVPQAAGDARD